MRPKKVILCVDDNEQSLSVRKFLLETRGYRVLTAQTSQEALEILDRTVPGTLDLLIADLLMPGMDGNELVRRAKQRHPMLPALIVSGTVAAYDRALAADAFLPKGAGTAAELLERIRVLVARKRGPKKHVPVRVHDLGEGVDPRMVPNYAPQAVPAQATGTSDESPLRHSIAS